MGRPRRPGDRPCLLLGQPPFPTTTHTQEGPRRHAVPMRRRPATPSLTPMTNTHCLEGPRSNLFRADGTPSPQSDRLPTSRPRKPAARKGLWAGFSQSACKSQQCPRSTCFCGTENPVQWVLMPGAAAGEGPHDRVPGDRSWPGRQGGPHMHGTVPPLTTAAQPACVQAHHAGSFYRFEIISLPC